MRPSCALLSFVLLASGLPSQAAAPKQVLILHSFGRDFAPFTTISSTLRTELVRSTRDPVVFYEAFTRRRSGGAADRRPGDVVLLP
jgi:hypothetical protein